MRHTIQLQRSLVALHRHRRTLHLHDSGQASDPPVGSNLCLKNDALFLQVSVEDLLGSRSIYDAALIEDKVISTSYDDLLHVLQGCKSVKADQASDLFVISKILRRQPKLTDLRVQSLRLRLAQRLSSCAAAYGDPRAILFDAEEVLRSSKGAPRSKQAAVDALTKLAQEGNGRAHYLLAEYFFYLNDFSRAIKAYEHATERGEIKAWSKLSSALSQQGYHLKAKQALENGDVHGDARSQFLLSLQTPDVVRQKQLLHRAVSSGSIEAAHNLGDLYRGERDVALAKEYFGIAARRNFQASQLNLALLYKLEGDYKHAIEWFHRARHLGGELAEHARKELLSIPASSTAREGRCCIM